MTEKFITATLVYEIISRFVFIPNGHLLNKLTFFRTLWSTFWRDADETPEYSREPNKLRIPVNLSANDWRSMAFKATASFPAVAPCWPPFSIHSTKSLIQRSWQVQFSFSIASMERSLNPSFRARSFHLAPMPSGSCRSCMSDSVSE